MRRSCKLAATLLIFLPFLARAIGDSSGGCVTPEWIRLAANGSPTQLEAAVDQAAALRRKQQPRLQADQARHAVLNAAYDCNAPQGVRLLDLAAAAGNLANVEFLLRAGADPNAKEPRNGGQTIFMRCIDLRPDGGVATPFWNDNRPAEVVRAKLAALLTIINRGGDIRARTAANATALHLCNDPAAIALYIQASGPAAPAALGSPHSPGSTTPLDLRAYQVVTSPSLPWRTQTLPIAQLLASSAASRAVSPQTEHAICYFCSGVEIISECRALSQILTVKDPRIFRSKGYTTNENSRTFRCAALQDPDCTNCSWKLHYKLEE